MDCYIRPMTGEEAIAVIPEMPNIEADAELWALFDEDGSLVLLTDNRSSTFFTAAEQEMTVKTRH